MSLLTVGHGTCSRDALARLLAGARIAVVVDVRRYPASRRHPHVDGPVMRDWLAGHGIAYRWDERLGGRRRGVPDSPHVALRNPSFRAYADHMTTAEWRRALADMLTTAEGSTTAVLCAESLWWRCHRRLVADAAELLEGVAVRHLGHDGRLEPHRPTAGVRVAGRGLVYDVGVDRPLTDAGP